MELFKALLLFTGILFILFFGLSLYAIVTAQNPLFVLIGIVSILEFIVVVLAYEEAYGAFNNDSITNM